MKAMMKNKQISICMGKYFFNGQFLKLDLDGFIVFFDEKYNSEVMINQNRILWWKYY